jgi:hypothetical protein
VARQREDPLAKSGMESGNAAVSWVVVVWGRIVVGLALATVGGVAFGHAWTNEDTPMWWVGAITLLTGVLLVLSGLYARSRPPGAVPEVGVRGEASETGEPLVPLLGAIIVYHFRWLSQQQLNQALEQQRSQWPEKRRIGEILVERGVISETQLQEALEWQGRLLREKAGLEA